MLRSDRQRSGVCEGRGEPGRGIVNMRDRIEAVGGALAVSSGEDLGTLVAGSVPVLSPRLGDGAGSGRER